MNKSNADTYLHMNQEIIPINTENNKQRLMERRIPLMSFQPGIALEKSEEDKRQENHRYAGVLD